MGRGDDQRKFVVHKFLLCAASPFFAAALTGSFKEATTNELTLHEYFAMAFEVLYQYIYTGLVQPACFYTKSSVPSDVLWSRTFKLADATMLHDLKQIAFKSLRENFNNVLPTPPTLKFISELFSSGYHHSDLRSYVSNHSAYWLSHKAIGSYEPWATPMSKCHSYGAIVAMLLAKVATVDPAIPHPCDRKSYDSEALFPDPDAKKPDGDKNKPDLQQKEASEGDKEFNTGSDWIL